MPNREIAQGTGSGRVQSKVPNRANTPQTTTKDTVIDDGVGSVTYGLEITKSLGNYEFLKIKSSVTLPYGVSDAKKAELEKLMIVAKEMVIKRIDDDVDTLSQNFS